MVKIITRKKEITDVQDIAFLYALRAESSLNYRLWYKPGQLDLEIRADPKGSVSCSESQSPTPATR